LSPENEDKDEPVQMKLQQVIEESASDEESQEMETVELLPKAKVFALWNRDGKFHPAEIIEKKACEDLEGRRLPPPPFDIPFDKSYYKHPFSYYVHFLECKSFGNCLFIC
jgi:hypothetical protein